MAQEPSIYAHLCTLNDTERSTDGYSSDMTNLGSKDGEKTGTMSTKPKSNLATFHSTKAIS